MSLPVWNQCSTDEQYPFLNQNLYPPLGAMDGEEPLSADLELIPVHLNVEYSELTLLTTHKDCEGTVEGEIMRTEQLKLLKNSK